MHTTTRIAGALAGLALAVGTISSATAAETQPAPCAQQQKQVDKAQAALDKVTAVFARQQTKVDEAKHELKTAATAPQRANAKRDLALAKDKRTTAKKAKTAQRERLDKATGRLDTCEADQPTAG